MTSSLSSTKPEDNQRKENPPSDINSMSMSVLFKEELRQSIIAKRLARGETQLKIEYTEPEQMELSPVEIEKKERRREQNRRAAQRCRNKKRMSQKCVIQNYEKVMSRNRELLQELNEVKEELKQLKKSCNYHSLHCPTFAKFNSDSNGTIKMETVDEDLLDNIQDSSIFKLQFVEHQNEIGTIPEFLSNTNGINSYTYVPAQSPHIAEILPSENFVSSDKKQLEEVAQSNVDFLQQYQPQSPFDDINDHNPWQYSPSTCSSQNQSTTSCFFNEYVRTKQNYQSPNYLNQNKAEEEHYLHIEHTQSVNENNCFQQYRPLVAVHTSTIPSTSHLNAQTSTSHLNAQSHMCLDQHQLLQSHNSPCQVVPSLRSFTPNCATPRTSCSQDAIRQRSLTPNCATPRTSCSQDAIRQRSLSGESISASEAPTPYSSEKRFSSVSSDGSLYIDNSVSSYQDLRTVDAHDIDTDDVFIGTSSGIDVSLEELDTNNNQETLPDNNRLTENDVVQFFTNLLTPDISESSIGDGIRTDNIISMVGTDDVNILMQISSVLCAVGNNEQSSDTLSKYLLPETQKRDY